MSDELPELMKSADGALVVVTTVAEGAKSGCVVGFHSQAGLEPERYVVWLSKANHTYRVMLRATYFAVHFLHDDDIELARHFGTQSDDEVDKFEDLAWTPGAGGVPLVDALPERLVLRKRTMLDESGDHCGVTGDVIEVAESGPFEPLRLSRAVDWDPGHDPEERAVDPR